MCSKSFLKRMLPFFATFAVSLFIASFFVSIGPNFRGRGFGGRHQEMKRLRMENDRLRMEKRDQELEIQRLNGLIESQEIFQGNYFPSHGPEVPVQLDVPMPPPPPRHR